MSNLSSICRPVVLFQAPHAEEILECPIWFTFHYKLCILTDVISINSNILYTNSINLFMKKVFIQYIGEVSNMLPIPVSLVHCALESSILT